MEILLESNVLAGTLVSIGYGKKEGERSETDDGEGVGCYGREGSSEEFEPEGAERDRKESSGDALGGEEKEGEEGELAPAAGRSRRRVGKKKTAKRARKSETRKKTKKAAVRDEKDLDELEGRSEKGHVYFMESADGGLIKIGFSTNMALRMVSYKTNHPGCKILGMVKGRRSAEKGLHNRFAESRVDGEWFRDNAELRQYIADNAVEKITADDEYGQLNVKAEKRLILEFEKKIVADHLTKQAGLSAALRLWLGYREEPRRQRPKNYAINVKTSIDMPQAVFDKIKDISAKENASMRDVMLRALVVGLSPDQRPLLDCDPTTEGVLRSMEAKIDRLLKATTPL